MSLTRSLTTYPSLVSPTRTGRKAFFLLTFTFTTERVRLLIHILCELRGSHDITAEKLKEAGQDVRRQISPSERLEVLDEIYYVRQMEEHYLAGDIGMLLATLLSYIQH